MPSNQYAFVLNCGSSSIKFALIEAFSENTLLSGLIECIATEQTTLKWSYQGESHKEPLPGANYELALQTVAALLNKLNLAERLLGIGHRVVHGGDYFKQSVVVDEIVLQHIEACIRLAPLHNPANLQGILCFQKLFPKLPQIAVFDTAFHQSMPEKAYLYPIPSSFYEDYQIRRYGFHGISYRYVLQETLARTQLPEKDHGIMIAHLGNGCSITAIVNGQSQDTSMGMTPLEGLMMGTRSGDLDPGLLGVLHQNAHLSLETILELLNKKSGLLGVSGLSMDMRTLCQAAEQGHEKAALAIDMFCYRLAKYIGAMVVTLPRWDALVFTGGIGENAVPIRAKTLGYLKVLGSILDEEKNALHGKTSHGVISSDNSRAAILVIPTQEERMIARDLFQLTSCTGFTCSKAEKVPLARLRERG